MKKIITLLLVLYLSNSFAQFSKVIDKDGYVNLREKANSKSKIIAKIKSSEVVFIFEDLGTDWVAVNYKNEKNKINQGI